MKNTTIQILWDDHSIWDAVKAVLRGEFTAIQAFLKKQEKNIKSTT